MKKITFLINFSTLSLLCFSQQKSIKIPLNSYNELKYPTWYLFSNDSITTKRVFPDYVNTKNCIESSFELQPLQTEWNEMRNRQYNMGDFLFRYGKQKKYNPLLVDTVNFTKNSWNNVIRLLTHVQNDSTIVIIPDRNCNNNYKDDIPIVVQNKKRNQILDISYYKITTYYNKYYIHDSLIFKIKLNLENVDFSINSIYEKYDWIELLDNFYKIGTFKGVNHDYIFLLKTSQFGHTIDYSIPEITFFKSNEIITTESYYSNFSKGESYKSLDTVALGSSYYSIILNETHDTLSLNEIANKVLLGNKKGFYLQQVKLNRLDKNTNSLSLKSSGKYMLLDFWGSWCQPCLKLFPEVNSFLKFARKNKPFEYVSIVFDKKSNLKKINEIILTNNLKGTHFFVDKDVHFSTPNSEFNKFNIVCFPTFILVDEKGKIILRDCGETFFPEAIKILSH